MKWLILCSLAALLYSCEMNNTTVTEAIQKKDSLTLADASSNEISDTIPEDLTPVYGYRFKIKGDFNGDSTVEILTERFVSALDDQETNKFYMSVDIERLSELTIAKKPVSYVRCSNPKIKDLQIAKDGQLLGLSYLKNEGDLNGDGNDEVAYVVNWSDRSNLNTCHIMTYQDDKWRELYAFNIWDWQLPSLPETTNEYGLGGIYRKYVHPQDEAANKARLADFVNFPGLVKKLPNNRIRVFYRNEIADMDTVIVEMGGR